MTTIAEKLTSINTTKGNIKSAIEAKGVTVGTVAFDQYPSKIAEISGGSQPTWTRPSDWLTMPSIVSTDEKILILFAVWDTTFNQIRINCQGNYTIDWGDGNVENFSSASNADHNYDYTSSYLDNTLTTRGYKQAIITITPQVGSNLTSAIFSNLYPVGGNYQTYGTLEVLASMPNGTYINFGASPYVLHSYLEHFNLLSGNSTGNNMFRFCYSLKSVEFHETFSPGTSTSSMFSYNTSLKEIPLFNTSSVTNMSYMFSKASSLQTIPLLNTSSVTTVNNLTAYVRGLTIFPAWDLNGVTSSTDLTTFVNDGNGIRRILATGIKYTVNIQNSKLQATELNEFFTNLATVTNQTVTITGNPGAATCDRTIATNKGWTVMG